MQFLIHEHAQKIAVLNDRFRQSFKGGRLIIGDKVRALSQSDQESLFRAIQIFNDFDGENDPYKEHDFGCVWLHNQRYYFQILCYDLQLVARSANPHKITHSRRVLILTHLDEIQTTSIYDRLYLNDSLRYCFKKSKRVLIPKHSYSSLQSWNFKFRFKTSS